jgi:hypothetical protein
MTADAPTLDTYLGLGGSIDSARATLTLSLATDACLSIVNPLPDGSDGVVLDVAARAYSNPTNAQTGAANPYSPGLPPVMGGLYLTKANIAMLRRLSADASSGAFSIDPTPADAGPDNFWGQLPEDPSQPFDVPPFYGDWDQIPV